MHRSNVSVIFYKPRLRHTNTINEEINDCTVVTFGAVSFDILNVLRFPISAVLEAGGVPHVHLDAVHHTLVLGDLVRAGIERVTFVSNAPTHDSIDER